MKKWWLDKPMRLIQTNLREIDVQLDVQEFVQSIKDHSANVLLINTGGIVANYPTKLEHHYKNPNLSNDFVGEIIKLAHEHDLRVIARFDFSRLNEKVALKHPEWVYKSVKGELVNYNGQIHTCLNGYYQQQYSIEIMTEVARNYPIEGVFINMHGYVTHDYSYNYHGICQCNNCRERFSSMYGHEFLPKTESSSDPLFRDYASFRQETIKELFIRRSNAIKEINENIAICNYTPEGTDIYRNESNSGIDRELPEFNFDSSFHVKHINHTWSSSMAVSNAAVHFVDFAMRHSAVSPHQTALRIAQNLVQGGWLDYYVIGTLLNQEDRYGMEEAKELFRFHQVNEAYYTNLESNAEIALICPKNSQIYQSMKEFRGIYRILSENHILFDVLDDSLLDTSVAANRLSRYKAVILPEVRSMSDEVCRKIDDYVKQGGKVLATGQSSSCDEKGNPLHQYRLQSLGVSQWMESLPKQQGTYFKIREQDKEQLRGFEKLDIIYLYGEFIRCEGKEDSHSFLGYIPPCMFGPPEKCYYTEVTDDPGMIHYEYGNGQTVLIPWGIGTHYEKRSNHGHSSLLISAIQDVLQLKQRLLTDTSPLVEIMSHQNTKLNCDLVHVVNVSGQLGTAYHSAIPIEHVTFTWDCSDSVRTVRTLRSKENLLFSKNRDDTITFSIPRLELLETIVIEYDR